MFMEREREFVTKVGDIYIIASIQSQAEISQEKKKIPIFQLNTEKSLPSTLTV